MAACLGSVQLGSLSTQCVQLPASRWVCKCKHERLPEVVWFTSKEMTQHAHNEQNQQQNQHENQLRKPTTEAATVVPSTSPRPAGPCCAWMVAAPVYLTHFTVSFEKLRHLNCCCYSIVGINNEWNRKLVACAATGSATGSTGNRQRNLIFQ